MVRRCAIGTANRGEKTLSNPRWYCWSGMIHSSAPFEMVNGNTGLKLFVKQDCEYY